MSLEQEKYSNLKNEPGPKSAKDDIVSAMGISVFFSVIGFAIWVVSIFLVHRQYGIFAGIMDLILGITIMTALFMIFGYKKERRA